VIPRRIYDQPISNFPSESWFQEIAREDFNDAPALASPPARVPAATEARRALQLADVSQDRESEVAA
jgi:hypothetical protein